MTTMGCGCSGSLPQVSGERQYTEAGERSLLPVQHVRTAVVMAVAVTVKPGQTLYGHVTGKCYGVVRPGLCFPMNRDDLEADKRLLKLTKETIRLFA